MVLREKLPIKIDNQNEDCQFCEVHKIDTNSKYGLCCCSEVLEEDKGLGAMILTCKGCPNFEKRR